MTIKRKLLLGGTFIIGASVGFIKGYDEGFDDGMETGEIKELVNQGFAVEDAKEIVKGRARMITSSQELFKR